MRSILVFLISFLFFIGVKETCAREEVFLIRIVSIEKDAHRVVADILDFPGMQKYTAESSGDDVFLEVTIVDETLAENFQPGDVTRVWGVLSSTGKELIPNASISSGNGGKSDPTGVRRRLKNRNNPQPSGRRGRGHG